MVATPVGQCFEGAGDLGVAAPQGEEGDALGVGEARPALVVTFESNASSSG